MERACSSVQLDQKVSDKNHGQVRNPRTVGRMRALFPDLRGAVLSGDLHNPRRRILTGPGAFSRAPAPYSWAPTHYHPRRHIITAIRPAPALAVNRQHG